MKTLYHTVFSILLYTIHSLSIQIFDIYTLIVCIFLGVFVDIDHVLWALIRFPERVFLFLKYFIYLTLHGAFILLLNIIVMRTLGSQIIFSLCLWGHYFLDVAETIRFHGKNLGKPIVEMWRGSKICGWLSQLSSSI